MFAQDFLNHRNLIRMNRNRNRDLNQNLNINRNRNQRTPMLNRNPILRSLMFIMGNNNRNTGLNPEQITNIGEIVFKKDPNTPSGEEEKCIICIVEYEDQETIRKLPCSHLFHHDCIDTWLVQKNSCPVCKRQIPRRN